jgi:hypothetical protein
MNAAYQQLQKRLMWKLAKLFFKRKHEKINVEYLVMYRKKEKKLLKYYQQ